MSTHPNQTITPAISPIPFKSSLSMASIHIGFKSQGLHGAKKILNRF